MDKPNRFKGTVNAIFAAGALFCSVFVLLAVQMLVGNDPAVGAGAPSKTKASVQSQQPAEREGTSWQSLLNSAADAVDVQAPAEEQQTYVAPQQTYPQPAPVQSSAS